MKNYAFSGQSQAPSDMKERIEQVVGAVSPDIDEKCENILIPEFIIL